MNYREKGKCTYQKYLDSSDGNMNNVFAENFIMFWVTI